MSSNNWVPSGLSCSRRPMGRMSLVPWDESTVTRGVWGEGGVVLVVVVSDFFCFGCFVGSVLLLPAAAAFFLNRKRLNLHKPLLVMWADERVTLHAHLR